MAEGTVHSVQLVFWILGVFGTFLVTIGTVMVSNQIGLGKDIRAVQVELALSRAAQDRRIEKLEDGLADLQNRCQNCVVHSNATRRPAT